MATARSHRPTKQSKISRKAASRKRKAPPKTFPSSFDRAVKELSVTKKSPVACTVEMSAPRYGRVPLPTICVTNVDGPEAHALPHELASWLYRNGIGKFGAMEVKSHTVIIEPVKDEDVPNAMTLLKKAVKAVTGNDPAPPRLNRVGPNEVPKPGHHIYVRTSLYLSHGVDDFNGGIATVKAVKGGISAGKEEPFVEIVERPGHSYNWTMLRDEQAKLEQQYGAEWSHPAPDTDPSANRWD